MKLRLSDTLNSLMLGGLLMASTFASARQQTDETLLAGRTGGSRK